jgi:hypothetical protein
MATLICATLLGTFATSAFASDLSVSITVGQPGFYGQISIGSMPRPATIYSQPVVVVQSPQYVSAEPIYLHVPPGHEKHWRKHCAEYDACGRPVYFVRDDWYNNEYVPRYKREHGDHDEHDHGHHKDHDHGRDHQDHG